MAAAVGKFVPGLEVEPAAIGRELKRLWEQSGETKTRASIMNLAVYSEKPDSLGPNTELISRVTEDHACRAIVISADTSSRHNHVEAWISAHCHVTHGGSRQVCSEQISFLLHGEARALLPNVLFSYLDSDLPLCLWWRDEFPEIMDAQLWAWVDRVIYDSLHWSDFTAQMSRIETAEAEAKQRIVLCDLNWTRIVNLRVALAQFFDPPSAGEQLEAIDGLEVEHAPGHRSTAVLLAGWLAAQLDWRGGERNGDALRFTGASGKAIDVSLNESEGQPISRALLRCGATEYCVLHSPGSDLLDVTVFDEGRPRMHQLMPAGESGSAALLSEELRRGGPHRVYLRAMNVVRPLL
jgi:glucose-6-phosphate dehydrogenase assembly protein OpcA